uniref:UhbW1 protein n=1 Tax=Ganoderma boninense TaxID=34458 RepID=A0A5K1JYC6_9APHY|nr:UhbW1 protein [Ganoderma boninense]
MPPVAQRCVQHLTLPPLLDMLPRPSPSSDILKKLTSRLHADVQRLAVHSRPQLPCATASDFSLNLNSLVLSDPSPLAPRLVELGVEAQYAERMSSALITAISRLKHEYQTIFKRRLPLVQTQYRHIQDPKFLESIPLTYHTVYNLAIRNHTAYLLDEVAPRVIKAQRIRQSSIGALSSARPRRPFNTAAVPILERFFDQNAFPTRLEKHELATQCNMAYRQIDIWNRRSRYRREGRVLKERQVVNPLFDQMEQSVMDSLLPEVESGTGSQETVSPHPTSFANSTLDTFKSDTPLHAFPSPYPPICPYDPFPVISRRCTAPSFALSSLKTKPIAPSSSSRRPV